VDQLKPALLQPVPAPFRCKKVIRGINPQQRRAFSRQRFAFAAILKKGSPPARQKLTAKKQESFCNV
jgi:hypothetical protein